MVIGLIVFAIIIIAVGVLVFKNRGKIEKMEDKAKADVNQVKQTASQGTSAVKGAADQIKKG